MAEVLTGLFWLMPECGNEPRVGCRGFLSYIEQQQQPPPLPRNKKVNKQAATKKASMHLSINQASKQASSQQQIYQQLSPGNIKDTMGLVFKVSSLFGRSWIYVSYC
jgi:hypothetical protein